MTLAKSLIPLKNRSIPCNKSCPIESGDGKIAPCIGIKVPSTVTAVNFNERVLAQKAQVRSFFYRPTYCIQGSHTTWEKWGKVVEN